MADRESLYCFISAVNNLEVCYKVIEACQHRSRFRLDNGFLRFVSCKLTDRLHRLPKGHYDKFDCTVNRAAEQVCSAMSCDGSKRRENSLGCVLNIFAFHEKAGQSQVGSLVFSLDNVFLPAKLLLSPPFHPHSS
jgi:hypothetical protein